MSPRSSSQRVTTATRGRETGAGGLCGERTRTRLQRPQSPGGPDQLHGRGSERTEHGAGQDAEASAGRRGRAREERLFYFGEAWEDTEVDVRARGGAAHGRGARGGVADADEADLDEGPGVVNLAVKQGELENGRGRAVRSRKQKRSAV